MPIEQTVAAGLADSQPGSGGRAGADPQKVLIVTDDVLTMTMAGPAIRAWQIATALSADHDVVLATTSPTCERRSDRFTTESADADRFEALERWCDVVIFQGYVLNHVPALRRTSKIMLVDLYDPIHLEALELTKRQPPSERAINSASPIRILSEQLRRGDFFVCASEKQRDHWLGFLAALDRINPATYDDDPSLRRLIDVAAFGLPDEPPIHDRQALKGVVPGIAADDEVILWGGGVYEWFDPITAIRAVDRLRARRPDVRLYFLGVRHPNPAIEEAHSLTEARRLAHELGLIDIHVFFNEGWVAYEDRQNFLLEADVAISLHVEHIETAFSFRTRILDYIWAGLPIVATCGDTFADLIEREGIGRVVPGGDEEAVEQALFDLLAGDEVRQVCRAAASSVSARFRWSEVLRPIVAFCAEPHRAADRPAWPDEDPNHVATAQLVESNTDGRKSPVARQLQSARVHYRHGGLPAMAQAAARKARGLLSR